LLLWDGRRNLDPGGLGEQPVTIQFVFPALAAKHRFYCVAVDSHDVDLCLTDPGRDVDVTVEADLRTLTEVWMRDALFADALADQRITLRGPNRLTHRISAWFEQNPHFAQLRPGGPPTA
jgi:hypothetical protein